DEYSKITTEAEEKPGYGLRPDTTKIIEPNGTEIPISAGERLIIGRSEKSQLTLPDNLPDNVTMKIISETNETNKKVKDDKGNEIKLAGEVYSFNFKGIDFEEDNYEFELVMEYNTEDFPTNKYDVNIYYFDGSDWIAQEGTAENGLVSLTVGHFSTYGVFAQEKLEEPGDSEEPKEEEKDEGSDEEEALTPNKAYEINYSILNEDNGNKSVADGFFQKPGTVLEYDGK